MVTSYFLACLYLTLAVVLQIFKILHSWCIIVIFYISSIYNVFVFCVFIESKNWKVYQNHFFRRLLTKNERQWIYNSGSFCWNHNILSTCWAARQAASYKISKVPWNGLETRDIKPISLFLTILCVTIAAVPDRKG